MTKEQQAEAAAALPLVPVKYDDQCDQMYAIVGQVEFFMYYNKEGAPTVEVCSWFRSAFENAKGGFEFKSDGDTFKEAVEAIEDECIGAGLAEFFIDMSNCADCSGALWVCEDHPSTPWPHADCEGAGMPCRSCNEKTKSAVAGVSP